MPINNCQYTLLVITSSFSDPEKILKTLREADFMLLEASNQQEAIQRIRTTSPYFSFLRLIYIMVTQRNKNLV